MAKVLFLCVKRVDVKLVTKVQSTQRLINGTTAMTRRNFLRTLGIGAVSLPVVGLMPEEPRYIIQSHILEPMGEIKWSSILESQWETAKREAMFRHHIHMEKLWFRHYYGIDFDSRHPMIELLKSNIKNAII